METEKEWKAVFQYVEKRMWTEICR